MHWDTTFEDSVTSGTRSFLKAGKIKVGSLHCSSSIHCQENVLKAALVISCHGHPRAILTAPHWPRWSTRHHPAGSKVKGQCKVVDGEGLQHCIRILGPLDLSPTLDDEETPRPPLPSNLHPVGQVPFSSSISVGPVYTLLATFTLPPGPKCGPSTLPSLHSLDRIWEGFMGSRQMLYPCLQTGGQGQ